MPFDLEPTPYAYSAFYRSLLVEGPAPKDLGPYLTKTATQMEAEFANMVDHGFNTLNYFGGQPRKTDAGWEFSELEKVLRIAKRAGLTRSPWVWFGSGMHYLPIPGRPDAPQTQGQVLERINDVVSSTVAFCQKNNFPKPAFYGEDERSGEELARLRDSYDSVNRAGGMSAVACYPDYYDQVGSALALPIECGGAQTPKGRNNNDKTHADGHELWIYNTPATNKAASPSVYRRRYGLAMWRNGENGAMPWEFCGVQVGGRPFYYDFDYSLPLYAMAYPTVDGKPIDTMIYEAFREGVYDTRFMVTLQTRLTAARASGHATALVAEVEDFLRTLSIHDDLQSVRRKIANYTVALASAVGSAP